MFNRRVRSTSQFNGQGRLKYQPKPISGENLVHQQVCDYLRLQYRGVIFHTDFAAGIKLTQGQAIKRKRLNSSRAFPDLFIAKCRNGKGGLFIEIKADGQRPILKDGSVSKQEHVAEQGEMLEALRTEGYAAEFGVGFEQCKKLIDDYLGLDEKRFDGF